MAPSGSGRETFASPTGAAKEALNVGSIDGSIRSARAAAGRKVACRCEKRTMTQLEFDGLELGALNAERPFGTVLADPPWRFVNRTGKVAPEHRRLSRYDTLDWKEIAAMPVSEVMADQSHCYLWVPNALITRKGSR